VSGRFPLSYRVLPGSGSAVVLLHGMLSSHHYFTRPLLGRWRGSRMVVPDLLGFGDSRKPDGGYTVEDHLRPLRDLVEAEGHPAPLFLGGHSLGAALAVALAASLPEGAVAGLVLLNLPRFTSAVEFHETLRAGSPEYRKATEAMVGLDEEALRKKSGDILTRFASFLPMPFKDDRRLPSPAALEGTARHCLYEFRIDPHLDVLSDLPMLLIHGGRDEVAPASHVEKRLGDLGHARWVFLPDAGHHLLFTHAHRVLDEMKAFVSNQS